jgi:hypothetical protein
MKVIDNFLPEVLNNHFNKDIELFPYNIKQDDKLFFETVIFDGAKGPLIPEKFALYSVLLDFMQESMEVSVRKLFRIKARLYVNNQQTLHTPKIDLTFPHYTFNYYVNDADGDTIFYKEMYQGSNIDTFDEDFKHTPKQNQAVMFNGLQYHSFENPKSSPYRAVINVNFE